MIALEEENDEDKNTGFGVLIGISIVPIAVNAEEYDRKGEESPLAMERMYSVRIRYMRKRIETESEECKVESNDYLQMLRWGDIIKTKEDISRLPYL